MDIIKAAEDLRELEEAESFEEYIAENKEEICRILNEKSEELIEKGVKDINQGITSGQYKFEYLGDTVTVALENGQVQTAYGNYHYTYQEL